MNNITKENVDEAIEKASKERRHGDAVELIMHKAEMYELVPKNKVEITYNIEFVD